MNKEIQYPTRPYFNSKTYKKLEEVRTILRKEGILELFTPQIRFIDNEGYLHNVTLDGIIAQIHELLHRLDIE